MSAQFTWHEFVLVPLTPIHVGGGEESRWLPHAYRLSADRRFVARFRPHAVVARLSENERRSLLELGDRDPFAFATKLRARVTDTDIIERIAIAPESAGAVDPDGEGGGRRNQIDGFYRAADRPTLPGSSLKGAIRTAWIASASHARRFTLPPLAEWRQMRATERKRIAQDLERTTLELAAQGDHRQDTDPFRDVMVRDAVLPKGATRVDKVWSWKRRPPHGPADRGERPYDFGSVGEIHRERTLSVADGGEAPVIEIAIGLRAPWIRELRRRLDADGSRWPKRPPSDAEVLLTALEAHHMPLWERELEKFFDGRAHRFEAALALFASLTRGEQRPEAALVRLGWASHAEAKSIAGYRRIERPQARGEGRFAPEGSARHVIKLTSGTPLSFGWALLVTREAWERDRPEKWLGRPQPEQPRSRERSGGRGSSAPGGDPGRAGRQPQPAPRYRKGQRVRLKTGPKTEEIGVLTEDVQSSAKPDDEIMVEIDGDRERVKVRQIEGPA